MIYKVVGQVADIEYASNAELRVYKKTRVDNTQEERWESDVQDVFLLPRRKVVHSTWHSVAFLD